MSTPAKILRPGSAFTGVLPERRVIRQPDPFVGRAAEFKAWEASASVEQLKERFRHDQLFAAWYSQRGGL
jgi:hypothetical protein